MRNLRLIIMGAVLCIAVGCGKDDRKTPIKFNVVASLPHLDMPVPGVRYNVVEYRYGRKWGKNFGTPQATGWHKSGYTDQNGHVEDAFLGYSDSRYIYIISFYYDEVKLPLSIGNYIRRGPEMDVLAKFDPGDNRYDVRFLQRTDFVLRIYNIDCGTSVDSMRWVSYNCDETPEMDFDMMEWPAKFITGCGLRVKYYSPEDKVPAGKQLFKMEIYRNGARTTQIDTAILEPGGEQSVELYY